MSEHPESLRHLGQDETPPYTLHSRLGESPVRFSFQGVLLGKPTRWQASLWKLPDYPLPHPCQNAACQFMEIGKTRDGETPITIALHLPRIDDGALLKVLIMVRKYKRLRTGLICFGTRGASVD